MPRIKRKKSHKPSISKAKFTMSLSPIPQSPSESDPILTPQPESEPNAEPDPATADAGVPAEDPPPTPASRKPAGSKRSKKLEKYLAMGEQKLSVLKGKTLNLVPFSVNFAFSKHESLFKAVGLWDFAQLKLDKTLNEDLMMQLVAFYDPIGRKSTVNGVKISVSRADLARALNLPKKKLSEELKEEGFDSDEAGSVLSEFISSYMLFHLQEDDDACILPQEVLSATQFVKEGQANKVDWAGLIWGFVEKELHDVFKTGVCYYASHLQQLIRYQQPKFLEPIQEKEEDQDPTMEEEKQEDQDEDQECEEAENVDKTEIGDELLENETGQDETGQAETVLNLGLGSDPMVETDLGFSKEGDEVNWGVIQGKNEVGLRPCGFGLMEFENLDPKPVMREEDFKEEGQEGQIMHSFNSSTDLLQAMENVNNVSNMNQFGNGSDPSINIHNLDSGDFLSISRENHMVNNNNADPFYFGNNGKRPLSEINEDDDDDDDDDNDDGARLHAKRIRNDNANCSYNNNNNNDNEGQSDFFTIMEKAKMQYMEKNQALMNAQMEIQYASSLIQQKDQVIHQLEKARIEDQHRYRSELCRYEHEMNIMAQVISGYKKALKQNRALFSEYRRKFPDPDEEPYYVDVPNSGGLVVSRQELDRIKMERETEIKELVQRLVGEFESEWMEKFDGLKDRFEGLKDRFEGLEGKVELINSEIVGEKMEFDGNGDGEEREVEGFDGAKEGNGDEEKGEIEGFDKGKEGNEDGEKLVEIDGFDKGKGEVDDFDVEKGEGENGDEGKGEGENGDEGKGEGENGDMEKGEGEVGEEGKGEGEIGEEGKGEGENGDEGKVEVEGLKEGEESMEVEKTDLPLDE